VRAMFRVFRERDGELQFRPAAGYSSLGWLLVVMGVGFVVAIVVGHERVLWKLKVDPSVALALLLPVGFLWFGAVILRASRWQVVDPEARALRVRGAAVPLDGVQAVLVSTSLRRVRHSEYQTWELGLVSAGVAPETRTTLRELADTVEAHAAGGRPLPDGFAGTVAARLAACRDDLRANSLELILNAREGDVWRAAKRLGAALDLPLVDDAGAQPTLLVPALLDRPLVERLELLDTGGEAPEPPPSVDVDETGGRLRIEYEYRRWLPILAFGGTGVAFLGTAAAVGLAGAGWAALPIAIPGLVFLPFLPFAGRGHGRNTLEIDAAAIRYTSHFPGRRTREVPLAELEAIRANRVRHPSLDLVGGDRVVRCPMPAELLVPVRALVLHRFAR